MRSPAACAAFNALQPLQPAWPPAQVASDRVFNYLEATYPQYVVPASPPTLFWEGYTYRYYAATDSYAGTRDGVVYYLVPALSPEITPLGSVAEWLAVAESNGY